MINGGTVRAQACATSGDAGIDSDMGIHINGGTVLATGNMLDQIAESEQTFAVFNFAQSQKAGSYTLKNSKGDIVAEYDVTNDFMYLIISDANMVVGEYTLWCGNTQYVGAKTGSGMGGHMRPGGEMGHGGNRDDNFDPNAIPPDGFKDRGEMGGQRPDGNSKEGAPDNMNPNMTPTEMPAIPDGSEIPPSEPSQPAERPEMPTMPEGGVQPNRPENGKGGFVDTDMEVSDVFVIENGANYFSNVRAN